MIGIKNVYIYIMRLIKVFFCIFLFTSVFSWEIRKPLNFPRSYLVAPSVNGKIYAIGGIKINNEITNIVEEYDFFNDTWRLKRAMPQKRYDMGFAVVNNKIYIFGGVTKSHSGRLILVDDLNVYDPERDTWIRKRPLPSPRAGAIGIGLNNYIYVFGGYDFSYSFLDDVLIYDIERDTWLFCSQIPRPRARINIGYYESIIHIIGGEYYGPSSRHYGYNLRNNLWDTLLSLPFARYGILNTYLNNEIYLIGGEYWYQGRTYFLRRFDIYNCENNYWCLGDSINLARSYGGCGILSLPHGNFIYVVGGKTSSGITGSLEIHQLSGIKEEKKENIKNNENYQILGIYNLLGKKITKEDRKGIYFYLIKDKEGYKFKKKIVIK
ncbi:MAG: kelch repeat-containing protein [candidate division WOR-3 bacterium]